VKIKELFFVDQLLFEDPLAIKEAQVGPNRPSS